MANLTPLTLTVALLACVAGAQKKRAPLPAPISVPAGSFVLAGRGPLPKCVPEAMARLGGGGGARIVLLGRPKTDVPEDEFKSLGVQSVQILRVRSVAQLRSEEFLVPLLRATGVWLSHEIPKLRGSAVFESLLRGVLARGGVVGGSGDGALALARFQSARLKRDSATGFDVFPRAVLDVKFRGEAELRRNLAKNPGCVGWGIPERTALVVSHRRLTVIGKGRVTAIVEGRNGWSERKSSLDNCPYTTRWDELPPTGDFLSWTRSARVRCGPLFPPPKAPTPSVPSGTLILSGGGGVADAAFERFIEAAGGKDSVLVCIPTADDNTELNLSSYAARKLRQRGCRNVHVLHTRHRGKADRDQPLLAKLKVAKGVWMDGGRTYRLMDAYQATTVETLMRDVLARGGVIGGSSAGCQAQGDFLMRGKPNSNGPLWWPGYTQGFGFVKGVIIDAHFRQRNRQEPFQEIMRAFPQMLGIGVDAKTALVVRGNVGEVIGDHAVTFYDYRLPKDVRERGTVLQAGQRYDLRARKAKN